MGYTGANTVVDLPEKSKFLWVTAVDKHDNESAESAAMEVDVP